MRVRVIPLLVVLLALTLGSQAPRTQIGIEIPADVAAQAAAEGSALVIVGVRTGFVPEGALGGPTEVAAQRDAMHAAVDSVMGQAAAAGAIVGQRFETIPFFTARVSPGALAALAASADVTSIELDVLEAPLLAQSVPLINAPAAWAAGHTGAGWSVAILDTGVEKTHSFLTGKVAAEACYSNANGLGMGTTTCPGGVTSSTAVGSGVPCSSSIDGCEHGTHVAGIAAGANGPGGANGVAPGASLLAMQVFTVFSGSANCGSAPNPDPCVLTYSSDQVRALERVLVLAGAGNANRVASVNMSLGGGGPFGSNCDVSQATRKAAIDNLFSIGIATVIASGNDGFTTGVSSPACISTAVSVGSSSKTDVMSAFTNRSPSMVDLLAPGGDGTLAGAITSSVPGNAFAPLQGTSMAAPHVAGAWAILKQAVPGAGVDQVLLAAQNTGQVISDAPSGGSYRRINVNAARLALLGAPGGVPGPPGTPVITGAGNTVNINWTAPVTGGAPTSYTVLARLTPGGTIVATLPLGNVLGTSVAAPNGTFHVTVRASNASGAGPESAGVTFSVPIVGPPPGAPTGLGVVVSGNQATFTWTPPTGATTGYLLVASLSSAGPAIASLPFAVPPVPSATVTGIPPGTYFVRLAATNGGVPGPFSNEVVVTVAPPAAPTLNPASVVGNTVNLSWTPGAGPAATRFVIVAALTSGGPIVASLPVTPTSASIPGVPPGTYFVRVRGENAVGAGPLSNEITVVVP